MKTQIRTITRDSNIIGKLTIFLNDDNTVKGRQLTIPAFNLKAQVFPINDEPNTLRVSVPDNYTTNGGEQKTFWNDIGRLNNSGLHIPAYGFTAKVTNQDSDDITYEPVTN